MINKVTLSALCATALALCPSSGQAAELLLNGNFESPVQTGDGNHIGTLPTSWIVAETATATTSVASDSNLVRGVVTTGTGVTSSSQYLGICPDDPTGQQSLDGAGKTVFAIQSFALGAASPVRIAIDFGGRDVGSSSGVGSSWQLVNSTGTVVAADSGYVPATGAWVRSTVTTGTLPAGNYTFVVNLLDPDMIDAATITTVPEPSTFAAAGIGAALLGWVGIKKKRQK